MELPPGFRFHPTDEELITHYLSPKIMDNNFFPVAIGEADFNKCEPWDLPGKAKMGEKEWYFFCVKDRKYPTGLRTNRATEAGYWKATGKDREIYRGKSLVGMKKTLVFYTGRAPKGDKTNWVMHEFRLEVNNSAHTKLLRPAKNEWVICRVFKKSSGGKKEYISEIMRKDSHGNNQLCSYLLPPLMDSSSYRESSSSHATCFSNPMEDKNIKPSMIGSIDSRISSNLLFVPDFGNFQYPDSVLMQENSILRMLLENGKYSSNLNNNSKPEISQDTGISTDIFSSVSIHQMGQKIFEEQDDPSSSAGPVDLDCLWNY